jgi:hypothetical protein
MTRLTPAGSHVRTRGTTGLRRLVLVGAVAATGAVAAAAETGIEPAATIDFVRDIQPLFARHCLECHAGERAASGLRLDIKSEALRGGDGHGPAILPGRPDESPLVRFVHGAEPGMRMPPDDALSPPVPPEAATLFAAWVSAGAPWPAGIDTATLVDRRDHWSLRPVARPVPPSVADGSWPRGPIDRFILARLEPAGLRPAPEADRRTWLRRVHLDLVGLPPTPEQVAAFLTDPAPDAHERIVDALLDSPHYGERTAQHWLDVVRYADTHGYEVNTERPNAWPYRDWCVAAFAADTPYDRFVREQLAGDTLGADAATGFLVTAAVLLPGQIGQDDASKRAARQDALADVIINAADTFLGLTVGCARCHDHKFDAISQHDYYALQACFAGVEYGDRPWRTPAADRLRAEAGEVRGRLADLEQEITRLKAEGEPAPDRATAPGDDAATARSAAASPPEPRADAGRAADRKAALERAEATQKRLQRQADDLDRDARVYAGRFTTPHPVHLLHRGDPEQPRDVVAPRSPEVFDALLEPVALPADAPEQDRRRALADWLVNPRHPLTARVMVNRIWQWHFGTGLVESASDFGRLGTPPSHPELLDWLAAEFVAGGWSVKALRRAIVLSATYRQGTAADPAGLATDADGRLLWRFPARRLEAEAIRDSMLAASGRLDLTPGGRGFDLFKARGGLGGFPPIESFTAAGRRRMIYAHKIRMEKESVFGAFDCPDAGQPMPRRRQSTTPLQALSLFNSTFTLEEAAAFAARVTADVERGAGDPAAPADATDRVARQIDRAFVLALGRPPDADEAAAAATVVRGYGLATLCRALFNTNEFVTLP